MNKLKVIFMGTPVFAVPILQKLIDNYEVILVVSQPDRERDRKGNILATPVKELANKYNIPVYQPEKIRKEYQKIIDLNPDIIVTCAYGQIIPEVILNAPRFGCINVHGSLLPKYRGGAPIHHAIINGEDETGITIMYMDKGMDSGDIISTRVVPILDNDNLDSLYEKIKPISRLVNSRSKLSADEKRIATAIEIALRVDNVSESRRKERHKNFLIKQLEEERARLAKLEEERIAQEELERLRKEEEEKLKEELRKAHLEEFLTSEIVDIFAPEDGNYEGKTPLCPFTQKRYFEFDGKKRKVIRQNMQKILRYRANQKQIALKYENDRNYSKIAVLIDRCARIAKNLPSNEGWKKVIKCHTFVRGSFNAKIKNS